MDRKEMVKVIAEHFGVKAHYMRTPSFAFEIKTEEETYIVDRVGTITDSEDREYELEELLNLSVIKDEAIVADIKAEADVQIAISMEGYTGVTLRNLVNVLYSKQELIKKAIGIEKNIIDEDFVIGINEAKIEIIEDFKTAVDDIGTSSCEGLEFDFFDEKIIFEFLRTDNKEKVKVYSQLIEVLSNKAKELKRASSKQSSTDNPKYTMRTWLLRLGMIGDEYKVARKVLLVNLDGNGAFRHGRD